MADPAGDGDSPGSALLTALTTEHFVLQTAYSSTIAEAGARSTLYVMALSSSLVALGFFAQTPETFEPVAAGVLPVVFLLGLFTVVRLVDTGLESMTYLSGIAEIRARYRSLGPDAAQVFAAAKGRWPEAKAPSLALGPLLAFLGTTASMIAVVNSVVGGASALLLVRLLVADVATGVAVAIGGACAVALLLAFLAYQRWRFTMFDGASPVNDDRS